MAVVPHGAAMGIAAPPPAEELFTTVAVSEPLAEPEPLPPDIAALGSPPGPPADAADQLYQPPYPLPYDRRTGAITPPMAPGMSGPRTAAVPQTSLPVYAAWALGIGGVLTFVQAAVIWSIDLFSSGEYTEEERAFGEQFQTVCGIGSVAIGIVVILLAWAVANRRAWTAGLVAGALLILSTGAGNFFLGPLCGMVATYLLFRSRNEFGPKAEAAPLPGTPAVPGGAHPVGHWSPPPGGAPYPRQQPPASPPWPAAPTGAHPGPPSPPWASAPAPPPPSGSLPTIEAPVAPIPQGAPDASGKELIPPDDDQSATPRTGERGPQS